MQVPRVSKLLSEFSIYHFFDSPAHHFSCRPQIYPPLWGVCRANGSPTFTTFGNQVRELLPSVRMKQQGQYLLAGRRLRTVQRTFALAIPFYFLLFISPEENIVLKKTFITFWIFLSLYSMEYQRDIFITFLNENNFYSNSIKCFSMLHYEVKAF